jgi:hypothetical protein
MTEQQPQRVDPMAPVDAMADRLLGPVAQPPTLVGQIIVTGLRRATVLSMVEVFGSAEQRQATHRMMAQNRALHRG